MDKLIPALFSDLANRISVAINDINKLPINNPRLLEFRTKIIEILNFQLTDIQNIIDDNLFVIGINKYLKKLSTCTRIYTDTHTYGYVPLKHYTQVEEFLCEIVDQIYKEHNLINSPPILAPINSYDDYFWAMPDYEIIAIPMGEENSILNWPDLYHEMCHLIYYRKISNLIKSSLEYISEYYKKVFSTLDNLEIKNEIKNIEYRWSSSWGEEFVCDLFGTYMTGPAYAWTNLKIMASDLNAGKAFDYYSDTHPADEARMRLILMMLEKMNVSNPEITKCWEEFYLEISTKKPPIYDEIYPDHILKHLIDEIYSNFLNADIIPYNNYNDGKPKLIAHYLNEAWEHSRNSPSTFGAYEEEVVQELKNRFIL